MTTTRIGSVEVALHWHSAHAAHTDRTYFEHVNFWRDFFPGDLGDRLAGADIGEPVSYAAAAGELVESWNPALVRRLRREQFLPHSPALAALEPRAGRFYPRDFLHGVDDVFAGDRRPMRVLAREGDGLAVDLNHPFAAFAATIEARLVGLTGAQAERGGRANDIPAFITGNGPGMQAPLADRDTDFYAGNPFMRLDPRPDAQFYRDPRIVQHLDATAIGRIQEIYARFLKPGMQVLDLMSSWVSHLPPDLAGLRVTGLGLNREELDRNPALVEPVVHDLNADPRLPFADATFDAAICTVSVEYLIHPIEVFTQIARVLKPGAPFVLTFSDRWFPTKVIDLWTELHPFERVGLVLDYFRRAGRFTDLATESVRGLPRRAGDKYANELTLSDPVFAVWGRRGE
jgi:SAM-dependent methyltransferase